MNKYKTLFNNTLIFTISNFASKILVFLMLPLYTRVLTTEEFGSADLIMVSVNLLIPIVTLSLSEGVLRFTMDKNEDVNQVFSYGIKILGIGFVLLILLFPLLKMVVVLDEYVILFYLLFLSQSLNQYFNQFVRGINRIKLIGVVGVVQTFVTVASNLILLLIYNLGIYGFLASIVISNLVALIILFVKGRLWKYFTYIKTEQGLKRRMLKYSIPLTPTKISWWINNAANKYIINGFVGVSELGIFSAASRMPTILITVQSIFSEAWRLSAINEHNSNDSNRFFTNVYNLYNIVILLGSSILITFVKPLSQLLFGEEFYSGWKYVPFLLIAVIFGALSGFLGSINIAKKTTISLFLTSIVGAIIGIILNFVFVPKFGALAASVVAAISYCSIWVARLIDTSNYMSLKINYLRDAIAYIIIVFQAVFIIFFDNDYGNIVSIVSFSLLVYIYRIYISKNYSIVFSFLKSSIKNA